jgi:hypothetical protein
MTLFDRHPSSDALAEFASSTEHGQARERARVAAHLEHCVACRERVQWVRGVSSALAADAAAGPSPALRERVMASRSAGARVILPAAERAASRPPRFARWLASAAAVLVVALAYAWNGTTEAEAGATAGELRFEPAMPRRGERVRVTYHPLATLGANANLVLRARFRTPLDESYNAGIKVRSVATLARDRKGGFTGEFTLPQDAVFGAFVVEDEAARLVDDNDGRPWEMLTSNGSNQPSFEALDQRAHDLMGRNWEEGHATVRRLAQLYPDDVRSLSWLSSFQGWLGLNTVDSVASFHRTRMAEVHARWRDVRPMDPDLIGSIFWYVHGKDSTLNAFWRARLLAEAPSNTFAVQERIWVPLMALPATKDTAKALAEFDAIFKEAPRDRILQVAGMAFNVASRTADTATTRTWSERIIKGSLDTIAQERAMAQQFAELAPFRAEGIVRLRRSIAYLDSLPETTRPLGDSRQQRELTIARIRRRALAALGRALVADGKPREGLELLAASAEEGWDLSVLRSARAASLAAGDTAGAMMYAARIAKDPRTDSGVVAAERALATKSIGAAAWASALDEAERAFADRMLVHAPMTTLRGRGRLRDLNGASTDIATLAAGQVTVVAIWSRSCGPAVEDLPNMDRVAARLAAKGVRVISVADERTVTPELVAFLEERKLTMPTYVDSHGEVSEAFNSWGTPSYYVLDTRGRIRFGATSDAQEVLARAEAVRLEGR